MLHPKHLTVCQDTCITKNVVWCSALKPTCTRYNQKAFFFFPRYCVCHFYNKTENPIRWIQFSCFIQQWITWMTVCKHMKPGLCEMLCKACPKLIYLPVEYVLSLVPRLWDHLWCFWRCCLPDHFPSLKRIYFALFYLVLFQLAAAGCLMFNDEGISLPNTLFE